MPEKINVMFDMEVSISLLLLRSLTKEVPPSIFSKCSYSIMIIFIYLHHFSKKGDSWWEVCGWPLL